MLICCTLQGTTSCYLVYICYCSPLCFPCRLKLLVLLAVQFIVYINVFDLDSLGLTITETEQIWQVVLNISPLQYIKLMHFCFVLTNAEGNPVDFLC